MYHPWQRLTHPKLWHFSRAGLVFSGLISWLAIPAAGQIPIPVGEPFLINSVITGDQSLPTLAADDNGNTLAVWQSDGEDGAGLGIFGQRFDATGTTLGSPFQVNTSTAGDQGEPAADRSDDGAFVVVWDGQDASGRGVFARRYTGAGVPTTGEVVVNATTANDQYQPDVAVAENGNFLVVWTSLGQDGDLEGVYARLFGPTGTALTGELLVNSTTAGQQNAPRVTDLDHTNGFVVAWEGNDTDGRGIFFRRLSATGTFLGAETQVNSATGDDQDEPDIDASGLNSDPLNQNIFVVVWESPDTAGDGIAVRRFTSDGKPVGTEDQVNLQDAGDQGDPAVTVDSGLFGDGIHFVVTWTEEAIVFRGSPVYIRGRRLGSPGSVAPQGVTSDEFLVTQGLLVGFGSIATNDRGDFFSAWQGQSDLDPAGLGIVGQRYELALFADGFESGSTLSWSNSVP